MRLPLPNVHSDCRVCTGKYLSDSATSIGALELALAQFNSSTWNSDLLESKEAAGSFFRFSPSGDKFVTIKTLTEPSKLCQVVSVPEFEYLIVDHVNI
jgi:hypothetical protein